MKKLLGIVVLGLLWCNVGLAAEISYNEPLKRLYVLGKSMGKKEYFKFIEYAKKAESIFLSYGGGYGSEKIAPVIVKNKLPVFVGRNCFSACTIISLSSHALYASENTMFMFHESRKTDEHSIDLTKWKLTEQWLMTEYIKAGATKKFVDKIREARKKDTSPYNQVWTFWLRCKDVKEYFKKNKIYCNSISSYDGIKFIVENHPNIKNIYCSNNNEKKIIKVFFNPGCPKDYKEIKKNEYALLKESSKLISENHPFLEYVHDFNKMDTLIHEIGKLSESGITFDFDEVAKKHGFKSFKEAVRQYKKRYKVKLNVKQAKNFFEKVDLSFKIDYSQENLDRLYNNLINNKIFKKRTSYFKKTSWHNKALSGCISLKKELAKLTLDPNGKNPELYVWGALYNHPDPDRVMEAAKYHNERAVKKYKVPACDYIIIDFNDENYLTEKYIKKYLNEKNNS